MTDLHRSLGSIRADLPPEAVTSRLLTGIGSVVDSAVLGAARLAVDWTLMPRAGDLPEMLDTAAPFLEGELRSDPSRYLSREGVSIAVGGHRERQKRRLRGGSIISRRLSVPYEPFSEASPRAVRDEVRLEHWMHRGGMRRPTVLALHGFGMGYPSIDGPALFASELYRGGLDVALMTLPYHGRRASPGTRFSGQDFTTVDVAQLNEAVRRAVFEILAVEDWLRDEFGGPVGLMGLSLGGYLSALLAGLLPRLDFVVPIVPPVCIGDLAWRFFERSRHHAGAAPSTLREQLRVAYRVHSPLTYSSVVERDRLLIVAGRGDQIVPPEHPHTLWLHWGEPDVHWFSGSHLAPFARRAIAERIASHIAACCA